MKLPEKCALPNKFQMRVVGDEGFTHSCAVVGDRVKVKWARGWHEHRQENPNHDIDAEFLWTTCEVWQAEKWARDGGWIVVEEKAEQQKQEGALPDVFYFQLAPHYNNPEVFKATLRNDRYVVTWESSSYGREGQDYSVKMAKDVVKEGTWKLLDKKPLTAEQKRNNKEYREQIAALESSIRLNEQDIEHKKRLIASYEDRKNDLLKKIVEE